MVEYMVLNHYHDIILTEYWLQVVTAQYVEYNIWLTIRLRQ